MPTSIHEWLTFYPVKYPEGEWRPKGLDYQDVKLVADDGVELHAWYCPRPEPRAAVLVSQGNAGNLSFWADFMRYLHDRLEVSALIYDYRGYGKSQGAPSVPGVLLDARAARKELARREGISPPDIVLYGRSLGGAVSIDLAAEQGARGLVVESSFTSLRDVASGHFPAPLVNLLVPNVLNSLERIGQYRGPLLISHGDADRTVPYEHGERLYTAAHEPKRFITIRRGDHNDPQTPEYYAALKEFVRSLPPLGSKE